MGTNGCASRVARAQSDAARVNGMDRRGSRLAVKPVDTSCGPAPNAMVRQDEASSAPRFTRRASVRQRRIAVRQRLARRVGRPSEINHGRVAALPRCRSLQWRAMVGDSRLAARDMRFPTRDSHAVSAGSSALSRKFLSQRVCVVGVAGKARNQAVSGHTARFRNAARRGEGRVQCRVTCETRH